MNYSFDDAVAFLASQYRESLAFRPRRSGALGHIGATWCLPFNFCLHTHAPSCAEAELRSQISSQLYTFLSSPRHVAKSAHREGVSCQKTTQDLNEMSHPVGLPPEVYVYIYESCLIIGKIYPYLKKVSEEKKVQADSAHLNTTATPSSLSMIKAKRKYPALFLGVLQVSGTIYPEATPILYQRNTGFLLNAPSDDFSDSTNQNMEIAIRFE